MKITPAMLVLVALGFGRCGVDGALSRYLNVLSLRILEAPGVNGI
jgi:hypothetical protein